MDQRRLEGRLRWVCPACGFVDYAQLKVSAAVIARRDGEVLLTRRRREPFAGRWNLPAGYVEADEDPADAAVRECREETGYQVAIDGLFGVYYWDDDPRGNGVLIVYLGTVMERVTAGGDEGEVAFFSADSLPQDVAGAGQDRALRDWSAVTHEGSDRLAYRFCPRCAGRLVRRHAFGRVRPACSACGFIVFRDPKTAAGALVVQDGRVLLARRAVKPARGTWYVPAGFVEYDETPAQTAVRELREETGLEIALKGLMGVYDFEDQRHGRGTLILYRGRVVGGTLRPGDDADAVAFFGPDELPEDIAFESSHQALQVWREEEEGILRASL